MIGILHFYDEFLAVFSYTIYVEDGLSIGIDIAHVLRIPKTNPLVKAKDAKGIKEEVEKTDRNRSAYYNYYTQNRWGDAHNYDLAINAALGRETCVKMILDAAAAKEKTLG